MVIVVAVVSLAGCSYSNREALSEPKSSAARSGITAVPEYYTVARGDTLYSIAWRYGLDFRNLAARNGLFAPYRIYIGSRLRLRTGEAWNGVAAARRSGDDSARSAGSNAVGTARANTAVSGTGAHRGASGVDWHWPVRGQVTNLSAESEKVGVEILGADGAAIRAAAPGEVVYSGDRLIGYGKLIIIRHNDAYLSAYGNNRRLLVSEGLRVAAGQQIAEMGHSGTDPAKLYFEIRRNGKPVPPLDYLP